MIEDKSDDNTGVDAYFNTTMFFTQPVLIVLLPI
jgi:hypothetical protein